MTVAQRKILQYMEDENLNESGLAKRLKINRSTVNRYLNSMVPDNKEQSINKVIGIRNDWLKKVDNQSIAAIKIKGYIKKNQIRSQNQLAEILGVHRAQVSRWLQGIYQPQPHLQSRINQFFGIRNDWYDEEPA